MEVQDQPRHSRDGHRNHIIVKVRVAKLARPWHLVPNTRLSKIVDVQRHYCATALHGVIHNGAESGSLRRPGELCDQKIIFHDYILFGEHLS